MAKTRSSKPSLAAMKKKKAGGKTASSQSKLAAAKMRAAKKRRPKTRSMTRRRSKAKKPTKAGYTVYAGRCRTVYKQVKASGTVKYFFVMKGKRHTTSRPRR